MIAVIGAGPAGLAASWRLQRAGHEVVVLDGEARMGGWARSLTIANQVVDLGRLDLDPAMPAPVRAAIEELVDLDERPYRDRVLIDGRWVPYPPRAPGLLRRGLRPGRAGDVDEALWHKVLGTDPGGVATSPTSHRRAGRRDGVETRRVLGTLVGRPTCLYPRRGLGAICDALASELPDVRLRTKVTALVEHEDRVIVGLGDGRILTASHVVSTVGAHRTARWLGVVDPDAACAEVRSSVFVYLVVDGHRYGDVASYYLPSRQVLPVRVTEHANLRGRSRRDAAVAVLCAEVSCSEGDGVWRAPADALAQRVADDLVRSGLPDAVVREVHVDRIAGLTPVLTPEAVRALDQARDALRASARVTLVDVDVGALASDRVVTSVEAGFAAGAAFDGSQSNRAR